MHFVGMDFKRWLHDFISFENSHHSKLARRILNMNLLISGSKLFKLKSNFNSLKYATDSNKAAIGTDLLLNQ